MNGYLDIVIYNVEHGNAIWVSTPSGRSIMFDVGRTDYFSPLVDIYNRGFRTFDAVVVTHPHADHYGDIANLRYFSIERFFRPCEYSLSEIQSLNPKKDDLTGLYWDLSSRYNRASFPAELPIADGVSLSMYKPEMPARTIPNNRSIVSVLRYGNFKMVLPGDCESPGWSELLGWGNRCRNAVVGATVVVAPHHGRESGYPSQLMDMITPDICLVSDGAATETNVSSRYSAKCIGRRVYQFSSGLPLDIRKCITTRTAGRIWLRVGLDGYKVYVDK